MKSTINHKDIGIVELKANKQAKRIIVRFSDNIFRLTHPYGMNIANIEETLDRMAPRLLSLKERSQGKMLFTLGSELKTLSFTVKIIENTNSQFQMILKEDILFIACPIGSDFADIKLQARIRNGIEQVLRSEAKRLFPSWTERLANQYQLTYTDVKVNKSRSRWGSCSSKRNINLSYFCLLLPHHLIELIILHELCHTIEMNHSERFWNLLNNVTNGNAKKLSSELKQFKTSF